MKRYLLFAGKNYYPYGGWTDFQSTSDEVSELIEQMAMSDEGYGWWQIVDTQTMSVAKEKKRS